MGKLGSQYKTWINLRFPADSQPTGHRGVRPASGAIAAQIKRSSCGFVRRGSSTYLRQCGFKLRESSAVETHKIGTVAPFRSPLRCRAPAGTAVAAGNPIPENRGRVRPNQARASRVHRARVRATRPDRRDRVHANRPVRRDRARASRLVRPSRPTVHAGPHSELHVAAQRRWRHPPIRSSKSQGRRRLRPCRPFSSGSWRFLSLRLTARRPERRGSKTRI